MSPSIAGRAWNDDGCCCAPFIPRYTCTCIDDVDFSWHSLLFPLPETVITLNPTLASPFLITTGQRFAENIDRLQSFHKKEQQKVYPANSMKCWFYVSLFTDVDSADRRAIYQWTKGLLDGRVFVSLQGYFAVGSKDLSEKCRLCKSTFYYNLLLKCCWLKILT